MDAERYLARIQHARVPAPTADALATLHAAHVRSVPFENLDIHAKRPIALDENAILSKVVDDRRGGFCYELNSAFAWLLRQLGYRVTLLSGRVARGDGSWGPEFDHLALRVDVADDAWLVDVGFGDSHVEPLRYDDDSAQRDPAGAFRLARRDGRIEMHRFENDAWKPQYSLSPAPRELPEFAGMCRHHQSSPESTFTIKRVVTLATPEGRVTLRDDRLIETRRGQRAERLLAPGEWEAVLAERFGIR